MEQLETIASYYGGKYKIPINESVKEVSKANKNLSREPAVTPPPQTKGNAKIIETAKGLSVGKNLQAYS
ncbi:MAG TPA: hypothetical protein PLD27_04615 [bacterium]|nr:hypothetical protein [bacterium]HOL46815.1 hypothetical protein [bacterium]HPQ18659.1 hypothetical protein [bacterium]